MNSESLNPATKQMLAEVREPAAGFDPVALRIMACTYKCEDLVEPLLGSLALPMIEYLLVRRYCRTLQARFKRYSGLRLAFELEDAIEMWVRNGLRQEVLEMVALEAWRLYRQKCEEAREAALRQT